MFISVNQRFNSLRPLRSFAAELNLCLSVCIHRLLFTLARLAVVKAQILELVFHFPEMEVERTEFLQFAGFYSFSQLSTICGHAPLMLP